MALNRVRLRNFQCHKKTEVKFDDVTTIIGSTDKGKSAIIRALRWLFLNEPNGTHFIRNGSTRAWVEGLFGDFAVKRIRSKKENEYDTDVGTFKALAGKVPEELQAIFNVSELNFQRQHDPPFWFTDSGGARAKKLNAIVNLEVIDKTVDRANKEVRSLSTELGFVSTRLETAQADADSLAWVADMQEDALALESLQLKIQEKQSTSLALTQSLETLQCTQKHLETVTERRISAEKLLKQAGSLAEMETDLQTLETDIQDLEGFIIELQELNTWLKETDQRATSLEKRFAEYETCPTCGTPIE